MSDVLLGWILSTYFAINMAILLLAAVLRPRQFFAEGWTVILFGGTIVMLAGLPMLAYYFIEEQIQTRRHNKRMAEVIAKSRAEVERMQNESNQTLTS